MKPNLCYLMLLLLLSPLCWANPPYPSWPSVGKAKLTVLWFDVYQAELSSPSGRYQQDASFMLNLTYLRDFTADALIDETFAQMADKISNKQQQKWRPLLKAMWPDVTKQDQISFVKTEQGKSLFFFNRNYLGSIDDRQFAANFAAIWLSKDSDYPKLAAKLTGAQP